MKKFTALLAATALMMLATSAWAIPITGTINFTGSELLTPGGSTLLSATGLDFRGSQVEGKSTGTYAPIANDTPVSFSDLTFKPSSEVTPIESFWMLTYMDKTYSFDLNTVNVEYQASNFLNLVGEGVLHATGFDPTPGNWFYSSQDGGAAFSAQSSSAPVPEPGTIVLLGAGFFGLAVFGKRRMNQNTTCQTAV